jgi:hypothetical protein
MGKVYLMYVDESGDTGEPNPEQPHGATSYYALIGIIVPADDWLATLDRMNSLRKDLKKDYSFPLHQELKGSYLFNPRGHRNFRNKKLQYRKTRMELYRDFMKRMPDVFQTGKVISLYLDKNNTRITPEKWLSICWRNLLERFHTYIKHQEDDSWGIVIPDDGNEIVLRNLTRKLRRHNPTASKYSDGWYNNPLVSIIEDPFHRASHHSFFIQAADMMAHALYRQENPKGSYKRFNAQNLFSFLKPILLIEATTKDPRGMGIIRP